MTCLFLLVFVNGCYRGMEVPAGTTGGGGASGASGASRVGASGGAAASGKAGTAAAAGGTIVSGDAGSNYDSLVLSDGAVAFWNGVSGTDATGNGHNSVLVNNPSATVLPNGGAALVFNGVNQYLEVKSSPDLSVPATGVLTLEAWIRPDVLDVVHTEGSGYVHWMGKGAPSSYEYASRMYGQHPTGKDSARINRISGYVFNPGGGLGAGSYYQPTASWPLQRGEWIHYVLVINTNITSAQYPTGYTRLYVHRKKTDGTLVTFTDQDALADYNIIPRAGSVPFRVGTVNFSSWWQGAVGKVAIYSYELSAGRALEHAAKMF